MTVDSNGAHVASMMHTAMRDGSRGSAVCWIGLDYQSYRQDRPQPSVRSESLFDAVSTLESCENRRQSEKFESDSARELLLQRLLDFAPYQYGVQGVGSSNLLAPTTS